MCPDVNDKNMLQIDGEPSAMESKSVIFNIQKCNSTRNKELNLTECKGDPEISTYVRDVMVETWGTFRKMNFTDKIGEPNAQSVYDLLMGQCMSWPVDQLMTMLIKEPIANLQDLDA